MYAVSSLSDRAAEIVPLHRWADGAAEVAVGLSASKTRLRHLYQSDPCRILFPRTPDASPLEAVIVTTSGGVVGGDRLRFDLEAEADSVVTFTTQAAEKIYKSAGATSEIDVDVRVGDGARAEWMPQETILFDRARLRRQTRVDLTGTARLLAGEIVVFGRRARGEVFDSGFLHDSWRVSRDGDLSWADALHLDGDLATDFENPYAFGGAGAVGMAFYAAPDAAAFLDHARDCLADLGPGCAVTAIDSFLVARFVNRDATLVRRQFLKFWSQFRGAALGFPEQTPRVWDV